VRTCEAIIFDLDNTLAESAWLWRESIAECARAHRAEVTDQELREWICPAEDAPAVGARLGVTADYVRRWCTAYAAERAHLVKSLPGADAMVSACADLVPLHCAPLARCLSWMGSPSTAGITAAAAAALTVVAIPALAKPAAPHALAAAHHVCADAPHATRVIRGLVGYRVPHARPAITTLAVRAADAELTAPA
jgi:beta-phosphoglucomutase-like phosphatase (HAD superfamily)